MLIAVTAAHIDAARAECGCAVARALRAALPGHNVYVGARVVYVDGAPCPVPPEVLHWCSEWDRGRVGDPFEFEFDPDARPQCDVPFVYAKGGA